MRVYEMAKALGIESNTMREILAYKYGEPTKSPSSKIMPVLAATIIAVESASFSL